MGDLNILSVTPSLIPINQNAILIHSDTVVCTRSSPPLNRLLQILKINLLQNTLEIIVKLFWKPAGEHLLYALVKNFLDLEALSF